MSEIPKIPVQIDWRIKLYLVSQHQVFWFFWKNTQFEVIIRSICYWKQELYLVKSRLWASMRCQLLYPTFVRSFIHSLAFSSSLRAPRALLLRRRRWRHRGVDFEVWKSTQLAAKGLGEGNKLLKYYYYWHRKKIVSKIYSSYKVLRTKDRWNVKGRGELVHTNFSGI